MIGRLRGELVHKAPPWLILDAGGVGYEMEASLATFQRLPETGEQVVLYTHLAVRDEAPVLYGFADLAERALFRALIRVSGVGAKLALLVLSGMSVEAFQGAIQAGDTAALVRLPGIGKKLAQRLVLEMRDHVGELAGAPAPAGLPGAAAVPAAPAEEAVSALVALGYRLPEASRMVAAVDAEDSSSEEIIRCALRAAVERR